MIRSARKFFHQYLNALWYEKPRVLSLFLVPLSWIYQLVVFARRYFYQHFFSRDKKSVLPVIVVGNITVGGAGKTPFVIWLADYLVQNGFRPGIISRGYGGKSTIYPLLVEKDSHTKTVGDEAVLVARKTNCPVVVAPDRVQALEYLAKQTTCNIVISDDGLQHYKLPRQIEIVIVDGKRMFGNAYCLPAGPLREPVSRLKSVDFIVLNGGNAEGFTDNNVYPMCFDQKEVYNIVSPELKASLTDFQGLPLHAVAGIGHPERFFQGLIQAGLNIHRHAFPDHYQFQEKDMVFVHDKENRIIMTEKDAVKCEAFADYRYWCVSIEAILPLALGDAILHKLR